MNFKKLLFGSLVLTTFSVSIILFNISCNKESDAQPQSQTNCIGPQPKIQFNANGKTYNGDYKFDQRLGWITNEYESTTIQLSNNLMEFFVWTSNYYSRLGLRFPNITNPTINTVYTYLVKPGTCYFDNTNGSSENGGTISLTFTRVSGGTADGTFSGAISYNSPLSQTITITNGTFANIPIFQY